MYLLNLYNLSESNGKNYVYPSAETIAKNLNVKPITAKRRLYELERRGLVSIVRRAGKTSEIYLTRIENDTSTRIKNDTTSSIKNDTSTRIKNDTQYRNNYIDRDLYKKTKNKIDGNHAASFDSNAYREKAQGEIIYTPKEEPQEEKSLDYLPF